MKHRRWGCVECGGSIIIARENEAYTAVEPCCRRCGLVHDFDIQEFLLDLQEIFRDHGAVIPFAPWQAQNLASRG